MLIGVSLYSTKGRKLLVISPLEAPNSNTDRILVGAEADTGLLVLEGADSVIYHGYSLRNLAPTVSALTILVAVILTEEAKNGVTT